MYAILYHITWEAAFPVLSDSVKFKYMLWRSDVVKQILNQWVVDDEKKN